jgi:hypothetical protein
MMMPWSIHQRAWTVRVVQAVLGVVGVVLLLGSVGAVSASAATPVWKLASNLTPTDLPPGGEGEIVLLATNLGDAPTTGQPVTVSDGLPSDLTVKSVSFFSPQFAQFNLAEFGQCTTVSRVTCSFPTGALESVFAEARPYQQYQMDIFVKVDAGARSGEVNEASVEGGGAASVSIARPVGISPTSPRFGIEDYELKPENEDGSIDAQAGSHPFQLTTTFALNKDAEMVERNGESVISEATPPALDKDLHFELPPGLVGNPTVFPQCTELQFSVRSRKSNGEEGQFNECPDDTVMGVAQATTTEFHFGAVPLFNLVPSKGEPARFGFEIDRVPVILDTSIRTGGDYGVVVSVKNVSQTLGFLASQVTFWGVPGDPRHDQSRGWSCLTRAEGECTPMKEEKPQPFLTLPTSCTDPASEPFSSTLRTDSWAEPSVSKESTSKLHNEAGTTFAMNGCNRLSFEPSISIAPDGQAGSTPTGLTVGVHVSQAATLNPTGLADADVKNTTVTLPAGVALNPAAADGLEACSEAQVSLDSDAASLCPEASKVGTVEISSPLVPDPLVGAVYLAAQNANPFGSLVALYLVAEDQTAGLLIKLAGEVKLDPVTGQLVSTFQNTPQLPFEDLKLSFFGGDRAPLSTPSSCGSYTTTAAIAPWSGNEPATPSSTFDIASGPNGSACSNPLPFSPSLAAGTTNIQAGAFSAFTMTMSREDGQQNLQGIQLHMPAGLSGLLSGVKLCGETEADAGTCGPESMIGETTVSVGLGGDPYSVRGGRAYITGPYHGAPFGLSIVVPAKAGPYDLGQVVVRGKIEVDPITAALTITTDTNGPYAIPHILDGIPLQIKHVNFTTTRTAFTFNPTNCDPMSVTGSLTSAEGASKALSVPFQVTNCGILAFKPGFTASSNGKTSRADGASLKVKLTYPKTMFGSQANIKSVKVDLPKQLPSRLTTLQKACTAAQFQANPSGCPAASKVGQAKAITPLIPVPLEGPAYFVSYGGAKFPELVVVLQGYGVTLNLHGETFISKAGITSSTFRTIPDAPVGSFELTLPQGKYSALAANGNLCTSKLTIPTAFTAQDGAILKQSTPVSVTGCAKHKTKPKKAKGKNKKAAKHASGKK